MSIEQSPANRVDVELRDHCVMVGGKRIPLLSGEIDYWLHPALSWREILQAVKDCSLPMVSCYVAWNHHQLEDGTFDFTGATDPQRDLARFLDTADDVGLYIFLRPGPWIFDHYRDGGVPPHASLYHRLDPRFLDLTRGYFSALSQVVRPRLGTRRGGKIILCQLDNEIEPMPSMRGSSGGTQISDDPVGPTYFAQTLDGEFIDSTSWRHWLSGRYDSVSAFSDHVKMGFESWDSIDVRRLLDQRKSVVKRDVLGYYEWYVSEYAKRIGEQLRAEDIDVPFALNTLSDLEPQNNVEFGEIADLVGGDYWGRNLLPWHDVLLYSRHVRHLRIATRTPWSAEYQSITAGELIHIEGVYTPQNATYLCLLAMLFGLKGWNWYVFAERSVLYFAPINNHGGKIHEYYDRFKQMHDEFLILDWPSYESYSDGGLWFCRSDFWDDVQYADSPGKPFFTHSEYDAGYWMDWFERFHRLDYDIDLFDPDASYNRVQPGSALVVSGHSSMKVEAQQRLLSLVHDGVNVIFLSTPPDVDECGQTTDLFEFLPRPIRVDGRTPGLVLSHAGDVYEVETDFLAHFDVGPGELGGQVESVIESSMGVCGYLVQTDGGRIAVLGFQPSNEMLSTLLSLFGSTPAVKSNAAEVVSSAWRRDSERLIVIVNTREEDIQTKLSIDIDRLNIEPEGSYRVDLRLVGKVVEMTGNDLAELAISLAAKSGELIRICPI